MKNEIDLVSLSLELKRIIYKPIHDAYDIRYIKILEEIFVESARRRKLFDCDGFPKVLDAQQ